MMIFSRTCIFLGKLEEFQKLLISTFFFRQNLPWCSWIGTQKIGFKRNVKEKWGYGLKSINDTDGDTWPCHRLKFCSRDTDVSIIILSIKNEKSWNKNNKRSKPEFFRLLWDIVVFKLVAYLLNIIYLYPLYKNLYI